MWYPWYAFEISEEFFELSRQAIRRDRRLGRPFDKFLGDLTNEIGPLTGGVSFLSLSYQNQRELLQKLGRACKRATKIKTAERYARDRPNELADGLQKAAAVAAALGMTEEALSISLRAPHQRLHIRAMVDLHSDPGHSPVSIPCRTLRGCQQYRSSRARHSPKRIGPAGEGIEEIADRRPAQEKLKDKLQAQMKKERHLEENERQIRDGIWRDTDRLLDHRLSPLLELTRALASFLGAPLRHADRPFLELVQVWAKVRTNREEYYFELQFNHFFQVLGTRMVTFALWARNDLKAASIRFLLKHLHQQNNLSPSTLIEVIAIVARRSRFDVIAGEQAVQARSLIEREDDVTTRSELFAKLARAILPVSARDAAEYFRAGLEQLDAIGSGAYEFTNELLDFASSIKGDELFENDFHTLTNICELNMSHEPEKFPWGAFATAMSKTSGPRGLAKLSRWHDRGKINLEYTLLPYITALVRDGKIAAEDALGLNRLADPAELWVCNTEAFATTMHEKRFSNAEVLIRELIRQYEENNPRLPSGSAVKKLAAIAGEVIGKQQSTTKYLSSAHRRFTDLRHDLNEQLNYDPSSNAQLGQLPNDAQQKVLQTQEIAAATNPLDEDSLSNAVGQLKDVTISRKLEQEFFHRLRARVRLADRSIYIGS